MYSFNQEYQGSKTQKINSYKAYSRDIKKGDARPPGEPYSKDSLSFRLNSKLSIF